MWARLKLFLNPIDGRYEDLRNGPWHLIVLRDFTAGLIVAMVAIPLAMGFAIASGLNPIHGIVGGAVAGLVGALFGGSKYQVYGPTAAYIPIILGIMATYGNAGLPSVPHTEAEYATLRTAHPEETKGLNTLAEYKERNDRLYAQGYGALIFCSVVAGIFLMLMGLGGLGTLVSKVPHSIVVGFTIGIALTIALTQIGDMLGYKEKIGGSFLHKLQAVWTYRGQFNGFALLLTVGTFFCTKYLLKISVFIPGPLIAVGLGYVAARTLLASEGLTVAEDKYGPIPTADFLTLVVPRIPEVTGLKVVLDLTFFIAAIVFVAAIESLLCSRMADRLADNRGLPYNPNKELWGQGMVNVIVPLLNGFPHTGALARTATNIKVGAVTPLAGIFKCWLKLALAFFLAAYLNVVPMACIGGILAYVAFNMVKPAEVKQVLGHNRFHVGLMVYTAVVVLVTDFLTGVLSALIIYAVLYRFLDKPVAGRVEPLPAGPLPPELLHAEGHTREQTHSDRRLTPAIPPEFGKEAQMAEFEALTMHRFRHLAVALARTEEDAPLIRYAALVAQLGTVAEVRFVHVLPPALSLLHLHDKAQEDLRAAVARDFTGVPAGVGVHHDVLKGPLLDRLLTYAAEQEVDVLLLGHLPDHTGQQALARRLAMKAPCSVWMVHNDAPRTIRRILVPIDFSDHAADQLLVATSLARLLGLPEVLALHVHFDEARVTYEEAEQVTLGEEQQAFDAFLAPLNCQGVQVRRLFEEGQNVAAAIGRVAEKQDVDLTVLATRGRSRSAAILLGSVTEGTIIQARRPVLVVKHFGAKLGLLQVLLDRSFWRRKGPQFD